MPRKPHRVPLSAMERTFSAKLAATGDHAYAAEKAGYAFPNQAASKLLKHPGVMVDVRKRIEDEISNELAPLANWRLRKVLMDETQKGSTHVMAAKVVLGYALNRAGGAESDLAEMSYAVLIAQANEARQALASLEAAKTIDVTPNELEPIESAQDAPNIMD